MGKGKVTRDEIKPVDDHELPPEFKKFDKPFGVEQHTVTRIKFGIAHLCFFYYFLYLWPFGVIPRLTLLLGTIHGYIGGLGITVGCHRYWTHKTFKANKPLKILLMLMQTLAGQYPIFKWCRDHRVHHKYTDTDADPHNSTRGFWFSHILWLIQPKHPEVIEKLKIIDMSDLARDPVVRFQSKYYWEIYFVFFWLLPMTTFQWLFPEITFLQNAAMQMTRYVASIQFTFCVNSIAHMWGDKPYDKDITSSENKLVSIIAAGEGWHNYHHTFPWDYKAAEYGYYYNISTVFIHFFAWIGWASDLKTVSHQLLVDRINRTGDGSHPLYNRHLSNIHTMNKDSNTSGERGVNDPLPAWGWGDKDLSKKDAAITETLFKR